MGKNERTILVSYISELINAEFDNRLPSRIPDGVSVKMICEVAEKQGMEYLLLNPLLSFDAVCREDKDLIREHVVRAVLISAAQMNEIDILSRFFENEGIDFQMLKGAVLKRIYPKPEMRSMGDIDILTDPKQIEKIQELLCEAGYISIGEIEHHNILSKDPFIEVEMHRYLPEDLSLKLDKKYFTVGAGNRICGDSKHEYEFSLEDNYVYMITHMARHFYKRGCGIRGLVDIYVYLNKYADAMEWEKVHQKLLVNGVDAFEKYMKHLAYTWLEKKKWSDFEVNLFDYMLNGDVYGKEENGIWGQYVRSCSDSNSADDFATRLQLRMWYIFPPYRYMSQYYSWLKSRPYLLPYAWAYRALRHNRTGEIRKSLISRADPSTIRNMQEIYKKVNLKFDQE